MRWNKISDCVCVCCSTVANRKQVHLDRNWKGEERQKQKPFNLSLNIQCWVIFFCPTKVTRSGAFQFLVWAAAPTYYFLCEKREILQLDRDIYSNFNLKTFVVCFERKKSETNSIMLFIYTFVVNERKNIERIKFSFDISKREKNSFLKEILN